MKCSYKGPLTESKPNGKGTLMYGDHIASGTWVMGELEKNEYVDAVSYTHLTLPTKA